MAGIFGHFLDSRRFESLQRGEEIGVLNGVRKLRAELGIR